MACNYDLADWLYRGVANFRHSIVVVLDEIADCKILNRNLFVFYRCHAARLPDVDGILHPVFPVVVLGNKNGRMALCVLLGLLSDQRAQVGRI